MIDFKKVKMITFNLIGPIIKDNQLGLKSLKNILKKNNISDNFLGYYNGSNIYDHIDYLVKDTYQNINNNNYEDISNYYNYKISNKNSFVNFINYKSPQEQKFITKLIYRDYIKALEKSYINNPNIYVDEKTLNIIHRLRNNNIKVTITTNIPSYITRSLIKNMELHNVINDFICDDQVKLGKPSSEMIDQLMKNNQVKYFETMKVSNTLVDIIEGQNANVLYNVILHDENYNLNSKYSPTHVIKSIDDLDINKINEKEVFITEIINNINPIWLS